MGFLKTFFFTFLAFQTIHAQNSCQPQFCGTNPLPIRFPFSLQDSQQPQNCGYPGFSLTCSEQESKIRTPVLNLPYGGNFSVRDINYLMQEIHLFDPNGCLPGKLLSLNLTSSPFAASYARNFTFLRCPPGVKIATVECLSNSTAAVVATSSESLVTSMNGTCSTMFSVGVPVSWSGDDWLSSGLSGDLRLTWSFPDCQGCEAQGRVCGYQQNSTSSQIVCNFDSKRGGSRTLDILKIIALSVVIPSVICSICISIFIHPVPETPP